jgi:hypothetical protein
MVTAILGSLTRSPFAEFECLEERIVFAEATGFCDDDTPVGQPSFNKSPWNPQSKLSRKHDARCSERPQNKGSSATSGKH